MFGGEEKEEEVSHAFFCWADGGDGVASFNPGCLRWQVRDCVFFLWLEVDR